ncbi:transcription elongation factor spt5 [Massospora cicadina]|nr:transcription elongation factor spt5 [Massospora cicadina]
MSRRNNHRNRFDEEEEEEDDEDDEEALDDYEQDDFVVEDDEDEDYGHSSRTKKKHKTARNLFIDDAAVDSEGEDEEYEDEEEEGFIDYDNEVPASSSRPSHYSRQPIMEEEESAEAIADRFNKKYQAMHDSFRTETGLVHRSAFPTADDPSLWMIKCKAGKEKDIVLTLMKRCFANKPSGQPYHIQSAFFRESLKGYIYIESFKSAFVTKATEKIPDLYSYKITLVPRKEMVDVVEVKNKASELKLGSWARIKRGKYQGDLCQVIRISDTQEMVRVKIIPRLDLSGETSQESGRFGTKRASQSTARPPQRLFNRREVEMANASRGTVVKNRGYYLYNNEMFKDGFLEKDVKTSTLITTNVNPTYDEITNFANAFEDENAKGMPCIVPTDPLAKILATLTAPLIAAQRQSAQLHVGDFVEIVDGNINTIAGTLEKIEGDTATVAPQLRGLQKISVPLGKVRKCYREGDYVKVIAGKFKGEAGSVVKVSGNVATVISDNNTAQIQVFTKDLGEASLSNSSDVIQTKFNVLDIVQLDHHTVGVVVKIHNGKYKVLDQNGTYREVGPQLITLCNATRHAVAIDSRGNPLNVGDQVKTTHVAGRQGTILHIAKTVAFIKAKETLENAGVFVEKTHFICTLTPRSLKIPQATPHFNLDQPRPQGHTVDRPPSRTNDGFAVPTFLPPNLRGRGGLAAGRGRGSLCRRDPLVNQTVTIRTGPYKGLLGIVKDVIENLARVELHTTFRIVSVDKSCISAPGPKTNWGSSKTPRRQSNPYHKDNDWANDFSFNTNPQPTDSSSWFEPTKPTDSNWGDSNAMGSSSWNDFGTRESQSGDDWGAKASNSTWGTPKQNKAWTPQASNSTWGTPIQEKLSTWDSHAQTSDGWGAPVVASDSWAAASDTHPSEDNWDAPITTSNTWDTPITTSNTWDPAEDKGKDSDTAWASDSKDNSTWDNQSTDWSDAKSNWQSENSWPGDKPQQATAPTPGALILGIHGPPRTPGDFSAATPGGALMSSLAPLGEGSSEEELPFLPQETPNYLKDNWFVPELIVKIGPNCITGERPPHNGKDGQVVSVNPQNRTCNLAPIEIPGTCEANFSEAIDIDWACLLPTVPKRRQRLYVVTGDRQGEFGVTVGQDTTQHYCRMDSNNALITLGTHTVCGAYTHPE